MADHDAEDAEKERPVTSKQRMLTAIKGGKPDSVPVAPGMTNMIPGRLTGKPFWEIHLYQDPPKWEAYIRAVAFFGFDGWIPGVPVEFDYERERREKAPPRTEAIVRRTSERIYTRYYTKINGKRNWSNRCNVYYIADPPTMDVPLSKVNLTDGEPSEWEDVHPRNSFTGMDAYEKAKELLGDRGVIGLPVKLPGFLVKMPEEVYEYYDDKEKVLARFERQGKEAVRRTREILKVSPDFLFFGMSGHMILNPEPIFREVTLPTLKKVTAMCRDAGVPSQIHCCGPEYDLVRISAEETDLTSINPLETPPMGDCDLAVVKREYGKRLSLMGNLHTTDVMLRGTPQVVERAAKKAIDDAAEGGGFILSTGDQCGRDTPDENIFTMIEVARNYGKY